MILGTFAPAFKNSISHFLEISAYILLQKKDRWFFRISKCRGLYTFYSFYASGKNKEVGTVKNERVKLPLILMKGLIGSVLLSAAAVFVMAFLLYKTGISESTIHIVVIVMYGVSCLLSGFYCGKKIKSRRFLWGLVAGLLYFVLLCGLTLAVKNGRLSSHVMTSALVCLGSGMLGGMISG